ncbi:hypothetical protein JTB14_033102 [Gonioctena quinquepunctata]|nr:hypothetical protein JTB14_033102 [Gonioctena quinquepunctata]
MKKRRELRTIRKKIECLPAKLIENPALPDRDYGPHAILDPDLPLDQFKRKKEDFSQFVNKSTDEIKLIELGILYGNKREFFA